MRKKQLMTDEERAEMLKSALEHLALLQLSDPHPTWDKALALAAGPDEAPVAYQTVYRWLQEPWGQEILASHKQRTASSGQDAIMRRYQRALNYQLAIACGEVGEPKDAVAAWKGLQNALKDAGMLDVGSEGQKPASVQVLIQQFSGTTAVREQAATLEGVVRVLSTTQDPGN